MNKYQQGGAPQGGNPEEQVAQQILQMFQQLSPETQQLLMEEMEAMLQGGAEQEQMMQQPQMRMGGNLPFGLSI